MVRVHTTEKSGLYLELTNVRLNILKQELKKYNSRIKLSVCSEYTEQELDIILDIKTLKFTSGTGGNKKIDGDSMQKLYYSIIQTKDNLKEALNGCYNEFIKGNDDSEISLQSFDIEMDNFVKYVSLLDLILTKAYISKSYNYCKPVINEKSQCSFVEVEKIRHPLIEQIQQNELYISNDIILGNDETKGVLLYGINAVGKSSFIRSLGSAIIMAQAGLFVPCSKMEYNHINQYILEY